VSVVLCGVVKLRHVSDYAISVIATEAIAIAFTYHVPFDHRTLTKVPPCIGGKNFKTPGQ